MKHELKPCPFCGGKAICHADHFAEDGAVAFVKCTQCNAQTDYFEDAYVPTADAVDAWNTRVGGDQ